MSAVALSCVYNTVLKIPGLVPSCPPPTSHRAVGANAIMPPAKKKKPATAALKPKEAHFARLEAALEQHNGKGSMLIMGVKSEDDEDDDDDDDDDEQDDDTEYTAEQIA